MLDGDKKIFMVITLNFYIIINNFFYTIIVKKLQYDWQWVRKKN